MQNIPKNTVKTLSQSEIVRLSLIMQIDKRIKWLSPYFFWVICSLAIVYRLRPHGAGAVVLIFIVCGGFVALISLALKTKRDDADHNLDTIKKVVETSAIIAAGLWAYFTFLVREEPTLHRESTITSEITVDSVNQKMHLSNLVTIKNNGKSNFDVAGPVHIAIWLVPVDTLTKNTYFDWEAYMRKTPSVASAEDAVYQGPYSPNDSINISHDFFISNSYNDKSKFTVLARAEAGFRSSRLWGRDTIIRDYAYTAKIRYKSVDGGSVIKGEKR